MKRTTKIIIVAVVVGMLLLGVGYAAIQNVTLNIQGMAVADPNQSNFKVMFSGTPTVSNEEHATAAITDETNATINVEGLTKKGDIITAVYTVQNASSDLSADLSVATTNSNTEYFIIKSELAKTSLIAGEATTLTVTVELTKTPIQETVSTTIGVQTTAIPVQPGEEGTSEEENGPSQAPESPLTKLTNDNIGDYIDLGNNIVGTEETTDDWRVLYVEDNTIYVILADYLPATEVPLEAGLNTGDTGKYLYSIFSTIDRDTLLNGLKNTTAWNKFTNGIPDATAMGAPTAELLINSYNVKNGTELIYTDCPKLDSSTEDYNVYVPHTSDIGFCFGYWLASPQTDMSNYVWRVRYDGDLRYASHTNNLHCSRPVVSLSTSTNAEIVDGIMTIIK